MNTTEPNSVPRGYKSLVGACKQSLDSTTKIKFTRMKMETRWSGDKKWVSSEEKKTTEVVDDSWRNIPTRKN